MCVASLLDSQADGGHEHAALEECQCKIVKLDGYFGAASLCWHAAAERVGQGLHSIMQAAIACTTVQTCRCRAVMLLTSVMARSGRSSKTCCSAGVRGKGRPSSLATRCQALRCRMRMSVMMPSQHTMAPMASSGRINCRIRCAPHARSCSLSVSTSKRPGSPRILYCTKPCAY